MQNITVNHYKVEESIPKKYFLLLRNCKLPDDGRNNRPKHVVENKITYSMNSVTSAGQWKSIFNKSVTKQKKFFYRDRPEVSSLKMTGIIHAGHPKENIVLLHSQCTEAPAYSRDVDFGGEGEMFYIFCFSIFFSSKAFSLYPASIYSISFHSSIYSEQKMRQ